MMFHVERDYWDVIVVGGGHAGCEAAAAAARGGCRTLLIAIDRGGIGAMSCNPSIGGVGKGHLVREIDVLDGIMARAADAATIHRRMLNASKGPALRGPRVQADRELYRSAVQSELAGYGNLEIVEAEVSSLNVVGNRITGAMCTDGRQFRTHQIIIASGTFLGGRLYRGRERFDGGRIGEPGAHRLAAQLADLGLSIGRMKTGTPPRLDGRSIDWSRLVRQPSDTAPWSMTAFGPISTNPQLFCGISRTTEATHDHIRAAEGESPLYAQDMTGRGPRYCPSIEDKVRRFGDRDGHQVFLEPETLDGFVIYPNGISTSMPADVQDRFVRTIPGLERAKIVTPGYAVEYGHIDARLLDETLEYRSLRGLRFAGQVNGSTGYEEAAAQGLVAGIGAANAVRDRPQVTFHRSESYIGVLIDDLTLQGVDEPYRMLTARAEFRLSLRIDNAVTRLSEAAKSSGVVGGHALHRIDQYLHNRESAAEALERGDTSVTSGGQLLAEIEADRLYAPYIDRQRREAAAYLDRPMAIPGAFRFDRVPGLSLEMVERLSMARPQTTTEAGRVRGVTPTAVTAIMASIAKSFA